MRERLSEVKPVTINKTNDSRSRTRNQHPTSPQQNNLKFSQVELDNAIKFDPSKVQNLPSQQQLSQVGLTEAEVDRHDNTTPPPQEYQTQNLQQTPQIRMSQVFNMSNSPEVPTLSRKIDGVPTFVKMVGMEKLPFNITKEEIDDKVRHVKTRNSFNSKWRRNFLKNIPIDCDKNSKLYTEKYKKFVNNNRKIFNRGRAPKGYHVHHMRPIAMGGDSDFKNLVLIKDNDHKYITAYQRKVRSHLNAYFKKHGHNAKVKIFFPRYTKPVYFEEVERADINQQEPQPEKN